MKYWKNWWHEYDLLHNSDRDFFLVSVLLVLLNNSNVQIFKTEICHFSSLKTCQLIQTWINLLIHSTLQEINLLTNSTFQEISLLIWTTSQEIGMQIVVLHTTGNQRIRFPGNKRCSKSGINVGSKIIPDVKKFPPPPVPSRPTTSRSRWVLKRFSQTVWKW